MLGQPRGERGGEQPEGSGNSEKLESAHKSDYSIMRLRHAEGDNSSGASAKVLYRVMSRRQE